MKKLLMLPLCFLISCSPTPKDNRYNTRTDEKGYNCTDDKNCNRTDGTNHVGSNTYYNDNQCSNTNGQQSSDGQITTRVKAALMSDSSLSMSGRSVSVETTNGVVTLSGTVPTKDESRYIERKVKSMSDVRKVNNQLTVNP